MASNFSYMSCIRGLFGIIRVLLIPFAFASVCMAWEHGTRIPELPELSEDELKPSFLTAKEIIAKKRGSIYHEGEQYQIITDDTVNSTFSLGNFCESLYFSCVSFSYYDWPPKRSKCILVVNIARVSDNSVVLYKFIRWHFDVDSGRFICKEESSPETLNLEKYKYVPTNIFYRADFFFVERRTTPFIYWIDSETNHYYPVKINGENIENHKSQ